MEKGLLLGLLGASVLVNVVQAVVNADTSEDLKKYQDWNDRLENEVAKDGKDVTSILRAKDDVTSIRESIFDLSSFQQLN